MSTQTAPKRRGKRQPPKAQDNSKAVIEPTVDEGKLGHDLVWRNVYEIRPSPENEQLYRPINSDDPEIIALARDIHEDHTGGGPGVREPLTITLDGWILSGHRRFAAAQLAGLMVLPCRVENIRRTDLSPDEYLRRLRQYNYQRKKTRTETLREEIVSANPGVAHRRLLQYRQRESRVKTPALKIVGVKKRCRISSAKRPFLKAILQVLRERRDYWPLSDRAIHYALLNAPPLIHASKPGRTYQNDSRSYKALVELLTRARLTGIIPMEAIHDPTRPVSTWRVYVEPGQYARDELRGFLNGYYRNLMQSQPNHIEIVCEKNTVEPIVRTIASEYTIPLTSGRGYCSLPPRAEMAERFKASGKSKLVLLLLSDHDPDGDEIAHSFARSMRDDFGIDEIQPIKVALTSDQISHFGLPPVMTAKQTSTHYDNFVKRHGSDDVFELEALQPADLQAVLRKAIDNVLDLSAYNAEIAAEHVDAAFLSGVRKTIVDTLKDTDTLEIDDDEVDE